MKSHIIKILTIMLLAVSMSLFAFGCSFESVAEHDAKEASEAASLNAALDKKESTSSKETTNKQSDKPTEKTSETIEEADSFEYLDDSYYEPSGEDWGYTDTGADGYNGDSDNNTDNNAGNNSQATKPANSKPVATTTAKPEPEQLYVTLTVQNNVYPDGGGYIVTDALIPIESGDSVYKALSNAKTLGYISSIEGSSNWVVGINGIAQKYPGYPESGWKYTINNSDNEPGVGCGSYTLNGGESITWFYVLHAADHLSATQ